MAIWVEPLLIGVDVGKAELAVCELDAPKPWALPNEPRAIRRYLKALPGPACIAAEATNSFHLCLVEEAHALGHTVYVIDGYRLNRYRESIGGRAKTDAHDARLLVRYLQRERQDLRPWSPPPKGYARLQQLLKRRAKLIAAKVALQQSLKELPELKASAARLLHQLERLDILIQKRLTEGLRAQGWRADVERVSALKGVGPITSAALAIAFHRGPFKNSDAFIAYLGLDVRVRDSGQSRGRRKLSKQGEPEYRRLLYLAAMQASRSAAWQPFYARHLERGLTHIQAFVALARKLARVAFALMKNQSTYQPKIPQEA